MDKERQNKPQKELKESGEYTIPPAINKKDNSSPTSGSIKKGYSQKELFLLYELGRLFLETGQINKAEVVFSGICNVAPNMEWAQMGLAIIYLLQEDYDLALKHSENALKASPDNLKAALLQAIIYLCKNDYPRAGTLLGELNEKLEEGFEFEPPVARIYKMQLARYHSRKKSL